MAFKFWLEASQRIRICLTINPMVSIRSWKSSGFMLGRHHERNKFVMNFNPRFSGFYLLVLVFNWQKWNLINTKQTLRGSKVKWNKFQWMIGSDRVLFSIVNKICISGHVSAELQLRLHRLRNVQSVPLKTLPTITAL